MAGTVGCGVQGYTSGFYDAIGRARTREWTGR